MDKILGFIKAHKILSVAAVIILAIGTAWAMDGHETYTWRYKTTVTLETPEGEKTGSAVREVIVNVKPYPIDTRRPYRTKVHLKGEAVVIDLGKRGVLFSLLSSGNLGVNHGSDIVFYAFDGPAGLTLEGLKYYSHLKDAKTSLDPKFRPTMVMFKDMGDPKTVTLAYGVKMTSVPNQAENQYDYDDHLEELFGKGVKLKEVTVEMTDDPVTREVSRYLPSFGEETGYWKWVEQLPYGDPLRIGESDFK
ncbi:MAG: hypothetical protein WC043_06470 [Pseudobdellovibrionaceae bacterium]